MRTTVHSDEPARNLTSQALVADSLPRLRLRRTAAFAVTALVVTGLAACTSSKSATAPAATPGASSVTSSTAATSPAARSSAPSVSAAQARAAAQAKVQSLIKAQPAGGASVGVLNTATGQSFTAGAASGMWTASAYKLFVLETLMMRDPTLSSSEQNLAQRAIQNSDNQAGYALFTAAGGRPALVDSARTFGMTSTVPGHSDPTFTATSGKDALALLRNLTSSNSPLSASTRSYILGLMKTVESDQRWGVGVAADKGSTFGNKNGWLAVDDDNGAGETDNGLWAVTSLGVITVHGQQLLMAVLTRHQPDFDTGIRTVQALAQASADSVAS